MSIELKLRSGKKGQEKHRCAVAQILEHYEELLNSGALCLTASEEAQRRDAIRECLEYSVVVPERVYTGATTISHSSGPFDMDLDVRAELTVAAGKFLLELDPE